MSDNPYPSIVLNSISYPTSAHSGIQIIHIRLGVSSTYWYPQKSVLNEIGYGSYPHYFNSIHGLLTAIRNLISYQPHNIQIYAY
jgi:hypothetical protein